MTATTPVLSVFFSSRPHLGARVQVDAADLSGRHLGEFVEVWHDGREHGGHLTEVHHQASRDGSTPRVILVAVGTPGFVLNVPADAECTVPEVTR